MKEITITIDQAQLTDICYALALASYEAAMNNCPLTSGMYDDLRRMLHKQEELANKSELKSKLNACYGYVDTDSVRLYCKNCAHCESSMDGTYCLHKGSAISANALADECSNYTEIQKPY